MRATRPASFLVLTLLASTTAAVLAPTAAAHTCYGPSCGPCTPTQEHEHHNEPHSYCTSEGDPDCTIYVRPVCVIIECLAADLASTSLALPRLAAFEGALGAVGSC